MTDTNTPADAWHKGVEPEVLGHWQTKGYDLTSPLKVATELTKAYREAEKFIGVPANQVLKIADAKNEQDYKAMWGRLGAPADAKEYDFPILKGQDGKVTDEALDTALRASFGKVHVTKDAATSIAADMVKHLTDQRNATAAEAQAKINDERKALEGEWKADYPAHMLASKNAALKLGVKPEAIAALEKLDGVGYTAVIKMFRDLAAKMGEDKFINNPGGGDNKVMTKEQAMARKSELMNDDAWKGRYLAGGAAENRELTALLTIIG